MHKIFFAFILMIFSSTALSEEWRYLLSREDDGKPIEMDFHSVKADKNYIFLDIRYAPPSGWKSLVFNVAYHQEAIVVSCEKQSYAIATEIDILKDGSKKIKSSKPLPSLNYITPEDGSEPKRIIKTLCEKLTPQMSIANQAPAQPQTKQVSPTLKVKSAIIENSPVDYNWRYLGEGVADKQKVFINTPSITRLSEDVVMVLTKSEYPFTQKTMAGVVYKYMLAKALIDCKGFTVVTPWMDFYSDTNHLVETFYREASELKEDKIPAGSLLEGIGKTACPIGLAKEVVGKSVNQSKPEVSTGTAWLVSSTNLITAFHVIDGAESIQVLVSDNDVMDADVVATDPSNDIAVLKLRKPLKSSPLYLATKQPRLGTKVAALGYPLPDVLGLKIQATTGEVSGLRGLRDDQRFYQISAPVQPGNSGGPLLNEDGEVVGIISSKLNAMEIMKVSGDVPQNVNFAMKYPYVKALMESAGIAAKAALKKTNSIENSIQNAINSVYLIVVSRQPQE